MTFVQILLTAHVVSGVAAVAASLWALFAKKGGRLHRLGGQSYVAAMWWVLGSATILSVVALRPYFAALTVSASAACFSGVRVLRRKRPDLDRSQRATALDWGVTTLFLGIGLALLLLTDQQTLGARATVFRALVFGALTYAAYDLWRFAFPAAFPFFPRLWFYEHLIKMLGSSSAVIAAFSGSILTFLPIPEPWKQLWPTIVFHSLMVVLIAYYAVRDRRRRRASSHSPVS